MIATRPGPIAVQAPLIYLRWVELGEFAPAWGEFLGSSAGLPPSVISRLARSWQQERERFANGRWRPACQVSGSGFEPDDRGRFCCTTCRQTAWR